MEKVEYFLKPLLVVNSCYNFVYVYSEFSKLYHVLPNLVNLDFVEVHDSINEIPLFNNYDPNNFMVTLDETHFIKYFNHHQQD